MKTKMQNNVNKKGAPPSDDAGSDFDGRDLIDIEREMYEKYGITSSMKTP